MIRGRGAGYVLLGLAALLVAVAIGSGWSGATRLTSRGDDAAAIEAAAEAFVLAYGTFDYRDQDAYASRLVALTTDALRGALTRASVDPTASTHRRRMTSEVEEAAVTALGGDRTTVTVVAVQRRRWFDPSSGREVEQHVRQRVSCALAREDGRWLVTGLRLLSQEVVRPAAGR